MARDLERQEMDALAALKAPTEPVFRERKRGKVSWAGDETDPKFDAIWDPTVRWNGWLCPFFDRENTQKLVDYNNHVHANDGMLGNTDIDTFEWDGDVLVQHYNQYPDEEPERIEPVLIDGVQHWTPGSFSWTWCEVDRENVTVRQREVTHVFGTQAESIAFGLGVEWVNDSAVQWHHDGPWPEGGWATVYVDEDGDTDQVVDHRA